MVFNHLSTFVTTGTTILVLLMENLRKYIKVIEL